MKHQETLMSAAIAAALLAFSVGTHAQVRDLEAKISGQVNRAMMVVDDGVQSESFFVDNDNSSTRFRFTGSAAVTPGLKAGIVWEMEFQGNDSNVVSMTARDTSGSTLNERLTAVYVEGRLGKITLGQYDGAANSGVEVDLSGTSVAHYAGNTDVGGGFTYRDSAGALSGPTIAQSSNQQDFESRYDLIRYDTTVFGGFTLAGSFGSKTTNGFSGDVRELALRYSGKIPGFGQLAAALGRSEKDVAAGDDEITGGSISWLHDSGFNATFGRTERDDPTAGRDKSFTYVKLGYKIPKHAFSVDYGKGEDQAAAGDKADFFGIAYVWSPVSWAEFYGTIKRYNLDRPGASFQDINIAMIGSRLKF